MNQEVTNYIENAPIQSQPHLKQLRELILTTIPEAEEVISYKMPAYKLNGMLVYFAGYEKHIGFYPTGSGIKHFESELKNFNYSKGTIQFRLDEPLPIDLIQRILNFRRNENLLKSNGKVQRKCENGHLFIKSSKCPICPICEKNTVSTLPFLELFPAPARRALTQEGITTIEDLKEKSPKDLLKLHGFGPSSLKIIENLLKQ